MTKSTILQFLNANDHAVISTASKDGKPESALIGFGQTDELEIIFGTDASSRKYANLQENNRVAFVIGWDDDFITVQYEGVAQEINGNELERCLELYHAKVPSAAQYQENPGQRYFKVTPTWIRYSDFSVDDDTKVEFEF